MTPEEQTAFLQQARKAALATLDQHGFPHIVAMGFVVLDGVIYMTSYAKAQKVLNARRNPKVSVMIETGTEYAEFRGVMIRGQCEVIDDPAFVRHILQANRAKQADTGSTSGQEAMARAAKRVVLKILPQKVVSWDHSKLGGRY
jgi:PPOX class probable F420-dependent enzyme